MNRNRKRNRRRLVVLAAAALAAGPRIVLSQAAVVPVRIGMLSGGNLQETPDWDAFYERMRSLGYVEGQGVVYERRAANGEPGRLPQLARELVAAGPRLIVTTGGTEVLAARQATSTIPIVMMFGGDPVATGLAKTLARPGGNVTGMTRFIPGFVEKALESLSQAVPSARRIGVLANASAPTYGSRGAELAQAAGRLGLTLLPVAAAGRPDELPAAFAKLEAQRPDALFVQSDVLFFISRREVVAFAARARLPAIYSFTEDVEAGGLMAFTVEWRQLYERAPVFIDKILKGASPAEIPIEQPTRAGLWVNLKAARALGITIPQQVLLRAERVIE